MLLTLNASFIIHQSFVLLQPRKKKKKSLSAVMVVGMDSGADNDDKGIAERYAPQKEDVGRLTIMTELGQ